MTSHTPGGSVHLVVAPALATALHTKTRHVCGSVMVASMEPLLGVTSTTRNWPEAPKSTHTSGAPGLTAPDSNVSAKCVFWMQ